MVVAAVVSAHGDPATIDRGRIHGLQDGDRGTIFYELSVAGESRRIDAGPAAVVALELDAARVDPPAGLVLAQEHRIEFRLPPDRLDWSRILEATPEKEKQGVLDRLLARQLDGDPELGRRVASKLVDRRPSVELPAGEYRIGLGFDEAERYDQQPAFDLRLGAFAIDRRIDPRAIGVDFRSAASLCAERGARLPTEFEWEAASREPGFDLDSGFYEWTSSRYRPYPGNDHPEEAYRGDYRVLRGDIEPDARTPHRRRFLQPGVVHERVAARCARDLD